MNDKWSIWYFYIIYVMQQECNVFMWDDNKALTKLLNMIIVLIVKVKLDIIV